MTIKSKTLHCYTIPANAALPLVNYIRTNHPRRHVLQWTTGNSLLEEIHCDTQKTLELVKVFMAGWKAGCKA